MTDYWVDVVDGDYAVKDGSTFVKGGFECTADAMDYILSLECFEKECDEDIDEDFEEEMF